MDSRARQWHRFDKKSRAKDRRLRKDLRETSYFGLLTLDICEKHAIGEPAEQEFPARFNRRLNGRRLLSGPEYESSEPASEIEDDGTDADALVFWRTRRDLQDPTPARKTGSLSQQDHCNPPMSKSGVCEGNQSLVFSEKMRIRDGEPKTEFRENMEDVWGYDGFDQNRGQRYIYLVGRELYLDEFGKV
ncbi:hypothetical protein BDV10DRAFT_186621 [Aspergillus recurvatus]